VKTCEKFVYRKCGQTLDSYLPLSMNDFYIQKTQKSMGIEMIKKVESYHSKNTW
jgi:hypothetical protein